MISVNLIKELREKQKTRNVTLRKGDTIKVMVGKYKGKKAKVLEIKTKLMKIYLEGIQVKKQDGSMANIPFRASNLQIIELNNEDKKRFKKLKTETTKSEIKSEIKEEPKIKKSSKDKENKK